jgi:uncharacterized repeat protein (TIGR01451 family)
MKKIVFQPFALLGLIFFVLAIASAVAGNFKVQAQENESLELADVSLTKTVLSSSVVQDSFQYRLAVTNNGPKTAKSVEITDPIPEDMSAYVTHVISGVEWGCDEKDNIINCSFPYLPSGATVVVDVVVFEISGETRDIVSTSVVTSNTFDPDLENNKATFEITAIVPENQQE